MNTLLISMLLARAAAAEPVAPARIFSGPTVTERFQVIDADR